MTAARGTVSSFSPWITSVPAGTGGAGHEFPTGTRPHLHPQAFDDAPVLQVLLDDLVDVGLVDVGVPDRVRVHHDARSFLAAVEAAGLVDPHLAFAGEAELLDAAFRVGAQLRGALGVTGRPIAAVALVAAEKHVLGVKRHPLF